MDNDVKEATVDLIVEVANTGARWLKGLGLQDWRRNIVSELRSKNLELMGAQTLSQFKQQLLGKIGTAAEFEPFPYFVVRPRGPADAEYWVPALGVEARENKDNTIHLGFHVLFFGKPQEGIHSFGHRFDAPEGKKTTHNYYHVQPLRQWRSGLHVPYAFQQQPDTFPTIPLQASDSLDLALHAVHVACGSAIIDELCSTRINGVLKTRANQMRKTLL
ncbi:hypothetical protein [Burkholderia cepacia]|uniref:hypothetical protein n=1 Tax=Burkholderia cepacia TaxID=292 RepID=UPI0009C15C5D|nr:hypothetical protein [Burkholderia cepacia]